PRLQPELHALLPRQGGPSCTRTCATRSRPSGGLPLRTHHERRSADARLRHCPESGRSVASDRVCALAGCRKRLTTQWHRECLEDNVDEEVTMTLPFRIATVVTVSTLFLAPVVFGQSTQSAQSSQSKSTPTSADFDACNKEAAAKAGNPSASPRPRTGPMVTGPGTPESGSQRGPAPGSTP